LLFLTLPATNVIVIRLCCF